MYKRTTIQRNDLSLWNSSFIFIMVYISTVALWNHYLGGFNVVRLLFFSIVTISILFSLKSQRVISLNFATISLILYFLYVGGKCIFNSNGGVFENIYTYIFLPLSYVGYVFLTKKYGVYRTITLFVVITVAVGFLAIFEYYTQHFLITRPFRGIRFRSRVFSDSCLTLACQLAVGVLLCSTLYKIYKKKTLLVGTIICGLGLLTTGSRGPFVGCVVALLVFIYLTEKNSNNGNRLILTTLIFVVTFVTIYLLLKNGPLFAGTTNPFIIRIKSILDWESDVDNLQRLQKWTIYYNQFLERPIFGFGPGYCVNSVNGVTESGVLQRLVEIGIVGAFFYYSFIIYTIKKAIQEIQKLEYNEKILSIGIICSCIVILVEDCVLQVFESTIVTSVLCILLATVFNLQQYVKPLLYHR